MGALRNLERRWLLPLRRIGCFALREMDWRGMFLHPARGAGFVLLLVAVGGERGWSQDAGAEPHVILVMTDGLRWQEVFRGADESLLVTKRYYNGRSVKELREKYLAATAKERRERLMPFLWNTL